jgi:hypothetical protein
MELLLVVAITLIVVAMAAPLVANTVKSYQLKSAAASATGVFKATRYRAIAEGYPMQVVVTAATGTYQIQADTTLNAAGLFDGNFVNVGTAEPLSGSGLAPTLGADITLYFSPSGKVWLVTAPGPPPTLSSCSTVAVPPPCQVVMTYSSRTETITVSAYGNIDVTP